MYNLIQIGYEIFHEIFHVMERAVSLFCYKKPVKNFVFKEKIWVT